MSFADLLRDETEVGVPRRFSIGTLFVLLTLYGGLFRFLVYVGTEATWTALVCLFFSAVTLGQMILFRGNRPRAASIVAGGLASPAMFTGLLIDEHLTGWSGWQPSEVGFFGGVGFIAIFLLLVMVGIGCGYVVGCATAGVFYVIGKAVPNSSISGVDVLPAQTKDSEWMRWLSGAGQWFVPVQSRTPLRGALAIFLIFATMGVLLVPFATFLTQQTVITTFAIAGFCCAIWSGNFQLWFYWPAAMITAGVLCGPWSADYLMQIPFFGQYPEPRRPEIVLEFTRFAGGLVGLTLSALVGWMQWFVRRKQHPGFGWKALLASCFLMVAIGFSMRAVVARWAESSTQQLLRQVLDQGGHLYWNQSSFLRQRIGGLDLPASATEEDFLRLRRLMEQPHSVGLVGPNFTDASVRAMEGFQLQSFALSRTSISDDAFAGMRELSASWVYLNNTEIGDSGLQGLTTIPAMRKRVEVLSLDGTRISDAGLPHMLPCKSLSTISLNGCNISDSGLAILARIKSLKRLELEGCSIGNSGLMQLRNLPALESVNLSNTAVTDEGLSHLAKCKRLKEVHLDGTRATYDGIAALGKAIPNAAISWSASSREDDVP